MLCNVCGKDNRCYSLFEVSSRGFTIVPSGMMFNICSICLSKLIDNIRTEKTILDSEDTPTGIKNIVEKVSSYRISNIKTRKDSDTNG